MALSDRAIERSTAVVHGFIRTRTGRMQKCARVTWKHGVLTFQAIRESPEIEKLYCTMQAVLYNAMRVDISSNPRVWQDMGVAVELLFVAPSF